MKNVSTLALAVSFATLVAGCGPEKPTAPSNWFADVFVKSKSDLIEAKTLIYDESSDLLMPAKGPFEYFYPYFDRLGNLVWLTAGISSPPTDWRMALAEFGVKPGHATQKDGSSLFINQFVGLPRGWSAQVFPPKTVDFMSEAIKSRLDFDKTPVSEKISERTFSDWKTSTWTEVLSWLEKPRSAAPMVADIFQFTYPLSKNLLSLGFGVTLPAFLGELDASEGSLQWVTVHFAASVKSPEQALTILGFKSARVEGKESPNSVNSALIVSGTGLRLRPSSNATIYQARDGSWTFRFEPALQK